MTLEEYKRREGLSDGQIAERVEEALRADGKGPFDPVRPQLVQKWRTRTRTPRERNMAAIYVATGGAVAPADFYELPELAEGAS